MICGNDSMNRMVLQKNFWKECFQNPDMFPTTKLDHTFTFGTAGQPGIQCSCQWEPNPGPKIPMSGCVFVVPLSLQNNCKMLAWSSATQTRSCSDYTRRIFKSSFNSIREKQNKVEASLGSSELLLLKNAWVLKHVFDQCQATTLVFMINFFLMNCSTDWCSEMIPHTVDMVEIRCWSVYIFESFYYFHSWYKYR